MRDDLLAFPKSSLSYGYLSPVVSPHLGIIGREQAGSLEAVLDPPHNASQLDSIVRLSSPALGEPAILLFAPVLLP